MYGDGSIYRRGPIWWMRFWRDGKEVRMSTGTRIQGEARKQLKAELKASRTDAWVEPADRKTTIGELVEDLKQHYRAEGRQQFADDVEMRWRLHLAERFEQMAVGVLATSHMRQYRADRLEAGDAQATINRELQIIRRAYRVAMRSEPPKVTRVPNFLLVAENNTRQRFFAQDEVERIRKAASRDKPWIGSLIDLAYTLGWRRGELLGLHVRDVNLIEGTVRIQRSKNRDPRECALTPALTRQLKALVAGKAPTDCVFEVQDIRRAWARVTKAAGLENAHWHDWRRTSARAKRAAGVDGSVIMAMSGWRSPAMLSRYGIVDLDDQRNALALLERPAQNQHKMANPREDRIWKCLM